MQIEKMKERLKGAAIGAVLTAVVLIAMPVFARVAQETITVNFNNISIAVDGRVIETENAPFIYQGRTFLPVRDVANAVGFDVTWEDATNTVHLTTRANLNVVPNYPPHQPGQVAPPVVQPPADGSAVANSPQQSGRFNRPTNPAISLEEAIKIAEADLKKRGIKANFHSNSGMDWERGQWVWELEFRVPDARRGRHVIEYYINVDTGAIVKFEQGD